MLRLKQEVYFQPWIFCQRFPPFPGTPVLQRERERVHLTLCLGFCFSWIPRTKCKVTGFTPDPWIKCFEWLKYSPFKLTASHGALEVIVANYGLEMHCDKPPPQPGKQGGGLHLQVFSPPKAIVGTPESLSVSHVTDNASQKRGSTETPVAQWPPCLGSVCTYRAQRRSSVWDPRRIPIGPGRQSRARHPAMLQY